MGDQKYSPKSKLILKAVPEIAINKLKGKVYPIKSNCSENDFTGG